MAEVSSQTLHIVARELASELNEARASLEAFGEQQDNLALLRKCNEHLHAVHGALRVAAPVLDEPEHTLASGTG